MFGTGPKSDITEVVDWDMMMCHFGYGIGHADPTTACWQLNVNSDDECASDVCSEDDAMDLMPDPENLSQYQADSEDNNLDWDLEENDSDFFQLRVGEWWLCILLNLRPLQVYVHMLYISPDVCNV